MIRMSTKSEKSKLPMGGMIFRIGRTSGSMIASQKLMRPRVVGLKRGMTPNTSNQLSTM